MCPVCGTPLGLASEAPQAQDERAYIQELVESCKSKDEIKQALVAEFGENVLALPGDQGDDDLGDVLVYVVPALGILLADRRASPSPWSAGAGRTRRAGRRRRRRTARASTTTWTGTTCDRARTASTPASSRPSGSASSRSSRPCVLPLVPGYLSTISGVSFADIQEGRGRSRCSARRCCSASPSR